MRFSFICLFTLHAALTCVLFLFLFVSAKADKGELLCQYSSTFGVRDWLRLVAEPDFHMTLHIALNYSC